MGFKKGKDNPRAKLTEEKVREIKEALLSYRWGLYSLLAEKYGVDEKVIRKIRDNKNWHESEKD